MNRKDATKLYAKILPPVQNAFAIDSYRTPPTKTSTYTTAHPRPYYPKWAEKVMSRHLINMTDNLITDLQVKFEAAVRIQDSYKHTKSYELGYLAAGVQEKFKLMLEIYRTFANIQNFMHKRHTVQDFLDAYHVMQGYYNDLRAQKALYYTVLAKYKRIWETREQFLVVLYGHCPSVVRKRYKKVPDEILQDNKNVLYNLRAYDVIDKCDNDKATRKDLRKVEWPPPSRRQFSDVAIMEQFNDEKDFTFVKWSAKTEDFKPVKDNLDIDIYP